MSDEIVTTPEEDAQMAALLASSHYVEDDGQMHDVTYEGDADEGEGDNGLGLDPTDT